MCRQGRPAPPSLPRRRSNQRISLSVPHRYLLSRTIVDSWYGEEAIRQMYRTCPRTFYESRVAIHTPITKKLNIHAHERLRLAAPTGRVAWVCAGGRLIIASISTPIKCPRSRLGSLRKESGGRQKGARQRTVGPHGEVRFSKKVGTVDTGWVVAWGYGGGRGAHVHANPRVCCAIVPPTATCGASEPRLCVISSV